MATLRGCCLIDTNTSLHKSRPVISCFGNPSCTKVGLRVSKQDTGACRLVQALDTGRRNRSSLLCSIPADPAPDLSTTEADISGVPAVAEEENSKSIWQNWRRSTAELRAKASKWGLAAVLAYGLFDGLTYTTFFVLAFLSYEKTTGKNPAANLKALLGVVVLMWGGNNVTRPFRVAGAAALAPFIDRGLKKLQEILRLPNQAFAFMICVASIACACFSVVGVLILSRLGG